RDRPGWSTAGTPPPLVRRPCCRRRCPEELRALLAAAAARHEQWTGTEVAAWMAERLGRPVSYRLGWSYRVRLRHRPQAPRSRHALADAQEQTAFKKPPTPPKTSGQCLPACTG